MLGPRHIVTAAHCTVIWDSPDQVEVVAGDHDRTVEEGSEQVDNILFLPFTEEVPINESDLESSFQAYKIC